MFARWGYIIYDHRRLVLTLWGLVLAGSVVCLPLLTPLLKGGGFSNGVTEADRAVALMQSDLHTYPTTLTLIFSSQTLRATDPAFVATMRTTLAPLARLPHVARIETYYQPASVPPARMIAANGHQTYAILDYNVAFDRVQAQLPQLRDLLHPSRLTVVLTGDAAIYDDIETVSTKDLQTVERVTFPVALVLLVLLFGTAVAALVPVIMGGVCVAAAMALLFLAAHVTDVSIFALNVTTLIGLGIGIDYSLLVVNRYREETQHRSVRDAIAVTMATAGRAVIFSGCTVMVGLLGLLMFQAMALRSMGMGGSFVVLVSVLAALTLLPALLGVLGERIEALPVLRRRNVDGATGFWVRLAAVVMRRPWFFIAGVLVTVIVIALPSTQLKLSIPDGTILPTSVASRQGFDTLLNTFHVQQGSPVVSVVYSAQPILRVDAIDALYAYTRRIARDAAVASIASIVNLDPSYTLSDYEQLPVQIANPAVGAQVDFFTGTRATLVLITPRDGLTDGQRQALVRRARATPLGDNLHVYVGGLDAGKLDYVASLYAAFPLVILFIVLATYLILLFSFRSVILPLKAVLMNSLSLLGAFGVVVFLFQEGHLANLLNFSPTGFIDEITPIVMFCTLFGLSMDYEVFLLSRMKERYDRTHHNTESVGYGLARTGRIVTSAALIMVVVAASFSFTSLVLIKALGVGVAVAILLDATLIRSLLVPATMRVLGDWNWWLPRWLDHWLPHLPLEDPPDAPTIASAHRAS